MNILNNFRINTEKEDYDVVIDIIDKGVVFKGTNLWILVFAIFIASLGLNVNSTAVIIGAMLVSPLMGPIMGLGLGMAINDLHLLKKALTNYLFASGVGLATSTIYFILTPINDAHSEILARISPNIYDVLIALFGGLAGMLATSSKQKGNVIPGVAIATALMPPLCTAGYGLATWNPSYFFGAFYLYLINTVFIALSTLITARFLKFPFKIFPDAKSDKKSKQIITVIVIVTVLPSVYFGYDIVQTNKFKDQVTKFIEYEAVFPNNYLLSKEVNFKKETIMLTYGGQYIEKPKIEALKSKLPNYNLGNVKLEVRQGFSYLKDTKQDDFQNTQMSIALKEKIGLVTKLNKELDSINANKKLSRQIYTELKSQYPYIQSYILQPTLNNIDSTQKHVWVSIIKSKKRLATSERTKIKNWLKVRLNTNEEIIYIEEQ